MFVDALGFIIGFAKILVVALAAICIGMLIKLLPKRIRGIVSAATGALFIIAVLKEVAAQQFVFLIFRSYIMLYMLTGIFSVTISFCVFVAAYMEARFRRGYSRLCETAGFLMHCVSKYTANTDIFEISSSHLKTSPVILQ